MASGDNAAGGRGWTHAKVVNHIRLDCSHVPVVRYLNFFPGAGLNGRDPASTLQHHILLYHSTFIDLV